jgi:RNA polymerase sigma factor (sigma-70 family)
MDINNKFIEEYKNLIYDLIRKAGIRDRETTDELFSLVIIRLIKHNNYDKEKAAVSTWLTLVTRSVIGNYLKSFTRSKDAMDQTKVPLSSLAGRRSSQPRDRMTIKDLVKYSKLTDLQKKILIMKYVHGDSFLEISKTLNLNFEQTRKIAQRSIKQLEKRYGER